jgi:uncharacterized membrane protein
MKKIYSLEHDAFRITILLKGVYSFLELLAGLFLLFITSNQIISFIANLFKDELLEDPTDFIATHMMAFTSTFSNSLRIFAAVYLIIHGAVKFGLIAGLWKKKIIFYPISLAVFGLFIAYQICSYILHPSLALFALTDLDMLIVVLTFLEYRHLR